MTKLNENQVKHEKPAQKEIVKNVLLAGKTITQAEFIMLTGNLSARLAPRILNLRDEGFDIENITEYKRDENGSHIPAKYRLTDTFLQNVATYGLDNVLRGELLAKQVQKGVA